MGGEAAVPHGSVVCASPLGVLYLEADAEGICRLSPGERPTTTGDERTRELLRRAAGELEEYFSGERRVFRVPLSLKGTEFQRAVWRVLQDIPYGQTRSYGEIARMLGRPGAARAVGMANHCNPVMIFVPCHRVVGQDGSLTGYAGGLEMKEKLLALEKRGGIPAGKDDGRMTGIMD